jgi:Putative peptidoglycan binding domain
MGSHQSFLRQLEREFEEEYSPEYEFEEELAAPAPPPLLPGALRSLRFADEPELHMVAEGRLRLGWVNDSPYPAPIRSQGRAVRKVQQALIDLGYSLPRYGDDGKYGQETYQAVLAYKRQFNIRNTSGSLDGIVGPKTVTHLDSRFSPGPLPACGIPAPPIALAESEYENDGGVQIPWVTCDPLIEPGHGSLCDVRLPHSGVLATEGGGPVVAPSINTSYCINQPHVRIEFTAWWEEMLPPDQRPPGQRDRAANAPRYDISFRGFRDENFIPGNSYVRDITVTSPGIGSVMFSTLLQRNRIFRVRFSISESP